MKRTLSGICCFVLMLAATSDLARAQQTRSKADGDGGMVAFSPDDDKDKTGSSGLPWERFIEIDNGGVNTVVECKDVAPWGPDGLSDDSDPPIAIDRTPTFGDRLYTADTEILYQKALTPICDWVQVGTDGAVPSGNHLRSFDQANNHCSEANCHSAKVL